MHALTCVLYFMQWQHILAFMKTEAIQSEIQGNVENKQ